MGLFEHAVDCHESGSYREVISILNKLIQKDTYSSTQYHMMLAISYQGLAKIENMTQNFKKALMSYEVVLELVRQGSFIPHELLDIVKKQVAIMKSSMKTMDRSVEALGTINGSKDKMRDYLDRKSLKSINNPQIDKLNKKIDIALDAGRYEEAVNCQDKLIKIDPNNGSNYYGRAIYKWQLPDKIGAIKDFKAALEYELPDNDRRTAEDGIKELEYDVKMEPIIRELHNKGIESARAGRYEEALGYFDSIIKIYPANGQTFHNRGVAKMFLGDDIGAIKDFKAALKCDLPDVSRERCEHLIKVLSKINKKWQREVSQQEELIRNKTHGSEVDKICVLCGVSNDLMLVESKIVCPNCYKKWWGKRRQKVKAAAKEA